MTVIASVVIDAEEFALGQALADTTTRIELTQFVPVGEQFVPYFWREHGGDSDVFERSVRAQSVVERLENLDGRVDASLYRIEWTDETDGFLGALRDEDIVVEEASTDHGDEWLFRLRALDQDALSAFQNACYDRDIPLDIRRVLHNPGPDERDRTLTAVTEKQYEALELALEEGYFDVPREHSATELAEKLGISRQAFSRRLQRAQRSVFADLLANDRSG